MERDAQEQSYSNGTVLDFHNGLRGIVKEVLTDPIRAIVVEVTEQQQRLRVFLEEGIPGVLDEIYLNANVFCAVKVTGSRLELHEGVKAINATCYHAINFGGNRPMEAEIAEVVQRFPEAARPELKEMLLTATEDIVYSALPPATIIAYTKAILTDEYADAVDRFGVLGYRILSPDFIPGIEPGIVNVVFHFANIYGQEKALLVPVRLRTYGELIGPPTMAVQTKAIVQVSSQRFCGAACFRCRVACRAAQALGFAACPSSTLAALACALVVEEAGKECYNRC